MITPETSQAAAKILRVIESVGYDVSTFHNPGSLLGTVKPFTEIHAIDIAADPVQQHIARAYTDDHDDADHAAAVMLAEMVGIDPG